MSESLENFTNIVKEDIKEAKTLFFSEAFKEEYLKDRREEKELYHQLLLGRNRNQILEEFLMSSGQKKPVLLSAAKTIYQATIMNLDEPLEIKVKREGWGYLVGRIKSDGTFLSLHKNTFQAEDFEDGTLTIYADMKTIPKDGDIDHLIIQTVYQTLQIEVVYKEQKSERKKEECERVMKDAEYRAKHARLAELMEQMKLVLWSVTWEARYKRKCNKCDCWRNVKVTLPSGNTVSDTCICAKTARVYHPKENVLYEIADRGLDFRVWYKERGDKGKEYFIADTIAVIPSKIIDRNKNFEEINKKEVYGIFFTSFEECQEFCSYLNKKEGVAGYDYDREGNLIAESTGEDNE